MRIGISPQHAGTWRSSGTCQATLSENYQNKCDTRKPAAAVVYHGGGQNPSCSKRDFPLRRVGIVTVPLNTPTFPTQRSVKRRETFPQNYSVCAWILGSVPMRPTQCSLSGVSTLRLDHGSFSQIPGSIGVQVLGRSLELCSTSELFWGRLHFFAENAEFPMCKLRVPNTLFSEETLLD